MFYVHPDPWGNEHQFDEHIVQMGWFNHQLLVFWETFFVETTPKFPKPIHQKNEKWGLR